MTWVHVSETNGIGPTTHFLVEIITPELHRRIRDDTDTIRPIASHESLPSFFPPHFHKSFPY